MCTSINNLYTIFKSYTFRVYCFPLRQLLFPSFCFSGGRSSSVKDVGGREAPEENPHAFMRRPMRQMAQERGQRAGVLQADVTGF